MITGFQVHLNSVEEVKRAISRYPKSPQSAMAVSAATTALLYVLVCRDQARNSEMFLNIMSGAFEQALEIYKEGLDGIAKLSAEETAEALTEAQKILGQTPGPV